MQSTNKASETIHQIFKIINVVYDPKLISFDSQELTSAKFKQALDLVSNIDISNVGNEVWKASDNYSKYDRITDIINDKFCPLLIWKTGIYDILLMKKSLQDDLDGFFKKLNNLGISFVHPYFTRSSNYYIQIGLRLLKVVIDLENIKQELKIKAEILEKSDSEKKFKAADNNIKIAPAKLQDFTRLIFKLYYENYFCPYDNKNGITEIDVLMAFEKFFDIDIVDAEWFSTDFMFDDKEQVVMKASVWPDYSNEELISKARYFFSRAANDFFIENLPAEFRIEKGKSMSILIYALTKFEPDLLTIPYRKRKMLHGLLSDLFKHDIGSYQSIFNYDVDPKYDAEEIEIVNKRINELYNSSKVRS